MATKSLEKVEFLAQADTDRADAFDVEALPDSRGIWYSPSKIWKLQMKRESLEKINGQANEMPLTSGLDSGTVVVK